MKKIVFTDVEMRAINMYGKTCASVAREAMIRSGLSFDDIEEINNHYETHNWGSNTDRKYRKAAINRAVSKVAAHPLEYI